VEVQGHSGCEEGHRVLDEGPLKGQAGLQRDPCSPASLTTVTVFLFFLFF